MGWGCGCRRLSRGQEVMWEQKKECDMLTKTKRLQRECLLQADAVNATPSVDGCNSIRGCNSTPIPTHESQCTRDWMCSNMLSASATGSSEEVAAARERAFAAEDAAKRGSMDVAQLRTKLVNLEQVCGGSTCRG